MSWENVYYTPEKLGLTPVAEIDYSSGLYEFDIRAVWRTEDGRLVTTRDSGCSCPSPFEDDDLTTLVEVKGADLVAEAQEELSSDYRYVNENQVAEFLQKVGLSWPPLGER